jgi:hypothetical protein
MKWCSSDTILQQTLCESQENLGRLCSQVVSMYMWGCVLETNLVVMSRLQVARSICTLDKAQISYGRIQKDIHSYSTSLNFFKFGSEHNVRCMKDDHFHILFTIRCII